MTRLHRLFFGICRIRAGFSIAGIVLAFASGYTQAMVVAPPIYPYELAYREATIVVRGQIISYDIEKGATLRVRDVVRGDARAGTHYLLAGSAGYSFLNAKPDNVTAFSSRREGETLHLWQGPTSGGLIWSESGLLQRIARARANPQAALKSSDARERLAGAFYKAADSAGGLTGKPTPADLDAMVESVAWGMSHGSPSTHQAAVDTLTALGYSLESIGISYHPMFKPELKEEAAAQLRTWWVRRRQSLN